MKSNNYIAIDLGASSGRVIVENNNVLDEIHRFGPYLVSKDERLTWDLTYIFDNIIEGLKKAVQKYKQIDSLAIDSWGVDYVLMKGDQIVEPVYSYRDNRTEKAILDIHKIISFEDLYRITGMQFQTFNTIYQLKTDLDQGRLEGVTDFLHIPEYLAYLLTGKKVKDYTMASTTGMLDLNTNEFSFEVIEKLNLPKHLFTKLNNPGIIVGNLKPEIVKKIGINIPVVLTATHDTGSAFEAVDVPEDAILISSGTWSLMGVKIPKGNNSKISCDTNFTNEGGISYIRYLKNIMGLWIYNEVKKNTPYSHEKINLMVAESDYDEYFDVNDPSLFSPKDMRYAILALLKKKVVSDGDLFRSIYLSLAHCYKKVAEEIKNNLNRNYKKIIIVGGGAKNQTLNDIIRDVTKLEVVAVPIEATALGNIKVQKGIKWE